MRYVVGLVSLLAGIVFGLALPDWDLRVSFLQHRSIVTHGLLWPLLFFLIARRGRGVVLRLFSMGLSLASAVHLSFDLFPQAWTGFALIHIPLYGRTSPLFSWLRIAAGILAGIYFTLALVRSLYDIVLAGASLIGTFALCAGREGFSWPALAALVVATVVALVLPAGEGNGFGRWRRRVM
jgi:hypothetical protein